MAGGSAMRVGGECEQSEAFVRGPWYPTSGRWRAARLGSALRYDALAPADSARLGSKAELRGAERAGRRLAQGVPSAERGAMAEHTEASRCPHGGHPATRTACPNPPLAINYP